MVSEHDLFQPSNIIYYTILDISSSFAIPNFQFEWQLYNYRKSNGTYDVQNYFVLFSEIRFASMLK